MPNSVAFVEFMVAVRTDRKKTLKFTASWQFYPIDQSAMRLKKKAVSSAENNELSINAPSLTFAACQTIAFNALLCCREFSSKSASTRQSI